MSVTLSVIVPAYNAEQYVESCVESIMAGTYRDFEVLLIDDGSTDGTGALCDGLQQRYGNIKVFHISNCGLPDARNLGIDQSSGRYIGFVDADDQISMDMYGQLVDAMDADIQLAACRFLRCGRYEVNMEKCVDPEWQECTQEKIAERIIRGAMGAYVWNKLYRRDILDAHGIRFPMDSQGCEDLYFNAAYLQYCEKAVCIMHPMYFYISTDGSIMDTFRRNRLVSSRYMSLPRAHRYAAGRMKPVSPGLEKWLQAKAVMFYQIVLRKLKEPGAEYIEEAVSYVKKHRSALLRHWWGWKYYLSAVILSIGYELWAFLFRRDIDKR